MKTEQEYGAKASAIWCTLTASERHSLRFGLFPYKVMDDAEHEGFDSKRLCVALMKLEE